MDYLDTSALVKLIFEELESAAVEAHVAESALAVSALSRTELRRVALRLDPTRLADCHQLIESCFEVPLSADVLDRAGLAEPSSLRSLDAIHVACAGAIRSELRSFVAYDLRLIEAAKRAGLPVVHPS